MVLACFLRTGRQPEGCECLRKKKNERPRKGDAVTRLVMSILKLHWSACGSNCTPAERRNPQGCTRQPRFTKQRGRHIMRQGAKGSASGRALSSPPTAALLAPPPASWVPGTTRLKFSALGAFRLGLALSRMRIARAFGMPGPAFTLEGSAGNTGAASTSRFLRSVNNDAPSKGLCFRVSKRGGLTAGSTLPTRCSGVPPEYSR
mmetsp:Transcript_109228/g.293789  ORF Transcript_109228/g.293789 Transcript_109228/m.293789 type:complete len:204 (+) Transcript_109228:2-613(+)